MNKHLEKLIDGRGGVSNLLCWNFDGFWLRIGNVQKKALARRQAICCRDNVKVWQVSRSVLPIFRSSEIGYTSTKYHHCHRHQKKSCTWATYGLVMSLYNVLTRKCRSTSSVVFGMKYLLVHNKVQNSYDGLPWIPGCTFNFTSYDTWHLHYHHFHILLLIQSFIPSLWPGYMTNPLPNKPFSHLPDWFHGLTDHLTFLFYSTAGLVCTEC